MEIKLAAKKTNDVFTRKEDEAPSAAKTGKGSKGGMVSVCGIIFAGNGPLKSQLFQSPFLKHYISSSIISIVDVEYGGKLGFYETVRKCSGLLKQSELENENKLIEGVMNMIVTEHEDYKDGNIVSIGFESNMVKMFVLSSGVYRFAIKAMDGGVMNSVKFAKNGIDLNAVSSSLLAQIDGNRQSIEVVPFIRFFDVLCSEHRIELKTVGLHSPITQRFANGLSGCVAVLHFPVNLRNDEDEEWLSGSDSK